MENLQANIDKLDINLQKKIRARPTNTILPDKRKAEPDYNAYKQIEKNPPFNIPKQFDGKKIWGDFLSPVTNQGSCGSCWAFASTSVLGNRFNIQSRGLMSVQLSPAKLILCDWGGSETKIIIGTDDNDIIRIGQADISAKNLSSCFGNTLVDAARYLYEIGTVTEKCLPYAQNLGKGGKYQKIGNFFQPINLPFCTTITGPVGDMCADFSYDTIGGEMGTPAKFYKCSNYYGLYGTKHHNPQGSSRQLQIEIYKWGPIVASMQVYADFYTFNAKTEIYKWNGKGGIVGGHAVEITGWGKKTEFLIGKSKIVGEKIGETRDILK